MLVGVKVGRRVRVGGNVGVAVDVETAVHVGGDAGIGWAGARISRITPAQ